MTCAEPVPGRLIVTRAAPAGIATATGDVGQVTSAYGSSTQDALAVPSKPIRSSGAAPP